jgi:hypothetical protein
MLDWLTGRSRPEELPEYSALRSIPSRELPASLVEKEQGELFDTRRETLERELCQPPRRPSVDRPLFTEVVVDQGEVITIQLPSNGGQRLPVFSTPCRAADYVRTLLASGPSVKYLSSSPLELLHMLRDLEDKVEGFALDRCPRCSVFASTGSGSVKTADDLLVLWSISKASELTRADIYFAYALDSARAGQLEIARDVALETIGHVSLEDPRPHLLLGQLAVVLKDRKLLREAKTFLRFFKLDQWEQKLDQVVQSGQPDFEGPE